jgi:hypothetical protein
VGSVDSLRTLFWKMGWQALTVAAHPPPYGYYQYHISINQTGWPASSSEHQKNIVVPSISRTRSCTRASFRIFRMCAAEDEDSLLRSSACGFCLSLPALYPSLLVRKSCDDGGERGCMCAAFLHGWTVEWTCRPAYDTGRSMKNSFGGPRTDRSLFSLSQIRNC